MEIPPITIREGDVNRPESSSGDQEKLRFYSHMNDLLDKTKRITLAMAALSAAFLAGKLEEKVGDSLRETETQLQELRSKIESTKKEFPQYQYEGDFYSPQPEIPKIDEGIEVDGIYEPIKGLEA